ncbi:MAG: hypothetical protein MJ087_04840 [Lachnospiraceae bacterium]|nr:hypothetical protein [Lachnospiraceae bacterium]
MTTQERYEIMYGDKKVDTKAIIGNNARVLAPERKTQPKKVKTRTHAPQPVAQTHSMRDHIRMGVAILAIAVLCICYLSIGNANYKQRRANALLKTEVSEMIAENDELKASITEATNLAKIKKIAVKRYGMKTPDKAHIIKYGSEKKDYVRQYSSIPD